MNIQKRLNYFSFPPPISILTASFSSLMSPLWPAAAVRAVGCRCARKLSTGRNGASGPRHSVKCQPSPQTHIRYILVGDSEDGSWSYARSSWCGTDGEESRRAPWAPDMSPRWACWHRGKARMTSFSSFLVQHMRFFSFEWVFSLNRCGSQRQTTNIWITWTHPIKKKERKKSSSGTHQCGYKTCVHQSSFDIKRHRQIQRFKSFRVLT